MLIACIAAALASSPLVVVDGRATRAPEALALSLSEHRYTGDIEDIAEGLTRDLSAPGSWTSSSWAPRAEQQTHSGRLLRFDYQQHGLPVLDRSAAVLLGAEGQVLLARVSPARPLPAPEPAKLTLDEALSIGMTEIPSAKTGRGQLALRADGALVYALTLFSDGPEGAWRVLIDADGGALLSKTPLTYAARGQVFAADPDQGAPVEVTLERLASADALLGEHVSAGSASSTGNFLRYASPDDRGDYLFDPVFEADDDPFAEVQVYHHLTLLVQHFADAHGHALATSPMVGLANFQVSDGASFDNAFATLNSNGNVLLYFGQGRVDFSYDVSVIAHEFGHGVLYDASALRGHVLGSFDELGGVLFPGAIHEGVADYWAASWLNDPSVATYSTTGRELDNSYSCPGSLVNESHEDGLTLAGALWALREPLGAETTDSVLYEAVGLASSQASFAELAALLLGVIDARVDVGELDADQRAAADAILTERGLLRCGRSFEVLPETREVVPLFSGSYDLSTLELCEDLRDDGAWWAAPFQLELVLPEAPLDGLSIYVAVNALDGDTQPINSLAMRGYLRRGEPVGFSSERITTDGGARDIPVAVDFDLDLGGWAQRIDLGADDPLLEQTGGPLFLAITHAQCDDYNLIVETTPALTEAEELPEECGCATGARPEGGLLLLLLALLARRAGGRRR